MTIRELVRGIQQQLASGNMTPDRASTLRLQLSALIGNCSEEIRFCRGAYAEVKRDALRTEKVKNRADVLAETTTQFQLLEEARDTKELVVEMGRALRDYLQHERDVRQLSPR
jgi:hypothetical protein